MVNNNSFDREEGGFWSRRTFLTSVGIAAGAAVAPGAAAAVTRRSGAEGAGIKLFNGKDLSGLYTHLNGPGLDDPDKVFTVHDGMIHISGKTYGGIYTDHEHENYRIVVTPNEYGDFLSDMACGMIGSIGLGASANYSFDEKGDVVLAMFDPAGGTAPDIAHQGICNPAAALLAFSMLLTHAGCRGLGTMVDEAVRECIAAGDSTGDLGGKLNTAEFTAAVIKRMGPK